MQGRDGKRDADRLADRQSAGIVNQVLPIADAHRVAVKPAGIGGLRNPPAQQETAVLGRIGSCSIITREISSGVRVLRRYGAWPVSNSYRTTPSE